VEDKNIPKNTKEPQFKEDGSLMQRNEGGWKFKLWSDNDNVSLDVACGKYLDTSLITVNLQPKYIIMEIKGKILHLNLPGILIFQILSD
jgi:hypothetical protein